MSGVPFEPWPKIARLNREVIITEKLDGTNAAVVIIPIADVPHWRDEEGAVISLVDPDHSRALDIVGPHGDELVVFAQSRTRFITPDADNFGFAAYVKANAEALADILGPGRHFGEWWGSGIQRGYGLSDGEKRFSLFNVARWGQADLSAVAGLGVVPLLNPLIGGSTLDAVDDAIELLRSKGSVAEPGFMRPEGVVVWHTAARTSFKVLLEGDDIPKGLAA
ncbi:RNA ligase [Microbacterium phage Caron]|uniref:RNA ligase n=1 Tax=Microbacterium phage Caron TaxID=3028494 RepID=A0AAE9ZNU7_9CAUD|nr:RNA ligase [Microbacterium phage Caron]